MKAGTHLVGAVALTTLYDRFVPVSWGAPPEGIESFVMLGAALIGGLLPDICHPNSTAGKKNIISICHDKRCIWSSDVHT